MHRVTKELVVKFFFMVLDFGESNIIKNNNCSCTNNQRIFYFKAEAVIIPRIFTNACVWRILEGLQIYCLWHSSLAVLFSFIKLAGVKKLPAEKQG